MRVVAALVLLALAAGFGWLGAQPWLTPLATAATEAAKAEAAAPVALSLAAPSPADLSRLAERPLFSAARRPPPPEEAGEPIADPNAHLLFGLYEVAGVVMLGDRAMAMLRDEAGRLIRIRAGDRLPTRGGEADVLEITLTALTFLEAGEKVVRSVESGGSGGE